ncbi:DUF1275 domain-containing protein [Sphingobium sp. BHU LFT2]|uniref:YoaK family protein n=1 Tax=Sphingobium sp. BHU LFT2 TaxID=2807634 RepID=UPI001BE7CDA9|nr:YoaK family protein [Sphingobium sp. BHU LFT2]MBT2246907.1 DUF1275 domain-containing protein [Sphingobium sp. BHU LFT2]
MNRYDRRIWGLAACFATLAGYVDALGFLYLGGFFVSFMSGNSTRLAVGLSTHLSDAATAAGLIASFVIGVMLGSLCVRVVQRSRYSALMYFIAAMLTIAALLAITGSNWAAAAALAMAMGAENALFERDGEVQIGLTYITGTLVKFGQRLLSALMGGDRFGWLPYLMLWLGLVTGAVLGAASYQIVGHYAIWAAAVAALLLAFWLHHRRVALAASMTGVGK